MPVVNKNRKDTRETTMPASAAARFVRNERGIALIIALVMLVLLTILGVFALSTSSTDLFIAGNYRNAQDSLYSADGGCEWAESNPQIYDAIVPGTTNIWGFNTINVGSSTADVKVEWLINGPLPPELATDENTSLGTGQGSSFQAAYYVIQVLGHGRTNTNAEIALETEIIKIVPQ